MHDAVPFDWFELNRSSLYDMLFSIKDRVVGQPLTVDQIHRKFSNRIKKFLPVRIKKNVDLKITPGWIWVGGAYYSSYDEDFKKSIEVNFGYNPNEKKLVLTSKRFSNLCRGFADVMLHEIIHMRQHRRRNWRVLPAFPSTASRTKIREEQEYLGCRDEIDAYSFNIACELHDKFNGNQNKIIKHLNRQPKTLTTVKDTYSLYLKVFGYDHNHLVIKHLKKKIVSYLPQAVVGKPYRNSEWINY